MRSRVGLGGLIKARKAHNNRVLRRYELGKYKHNREREMVVSSYYCKLSKQTLITYRYE